MSMQAKNKIRTNSQDEKINETSSLSEADKISSLPNDVLLNILSLLPIENAVATSVLSKRWRHVWTEIIGVLDFRYWEFNRRVHKGCTDDFDDFLVVLEVSYLDLVRCRFNGVLDSKCVSTCLASLLKRGFYKLELVCERTWPIMLPSSLLACEELVELKLFGDFTIRDLPSSLHWPNLKVVLIEDVDLADRDSLEDLLRGCPVLEKLYINNCKIKIRGTTSIDVCSSSLKILQYIACQYSLIRLMVKSIDTPNLEHLHLTNVEVLEVGAPNLRCLKLHDFLLSNDSYTKEMVLKDLLMGCHVLEELYLTNFQSREATIFDVCSSSLNILQYDTCQTVRNRFRIDTPNLRHLYLTTAEVVELRAPKLRCLKLRDFVFCEGFDMEEMPFIAETCLDPSSDCLSIVLKVLHTVSSLKALDLGIQIIRVSFLLITPPLPKFIVNYHKTDQVTKFTQNFAFPL